MKSFLRLRLLVVGPPRGVAFAMQRGRASLVAPNRGADPLVFDFEIVVDPTGDPPRLTGELTQGPPAARFVYINSGTSAGEASSPWTRRAKVPLFCIPPALIRTALAKNATLQASIAGTGKDGGPACASVPLLSPWVLVDAEPQ
jgi:hypothetical protein